MSALPHQTTGDLVTATIWNTQVDAINGVAVVTSAPTTTGNIAGLSLPSGNGPLVIFMNNATLATILGIAPGLDGQELTIFSIGAGQVDCSHQDAGATSASYRLINLATSGKSSLAAGAGVMSFKYSTTASRWRMVMHDQGAWITPTFAAGNYTANGAMSWTLQSGDVATQAYYLRGRTITVAWYLQTTTVGGTVSSQLNIGNGAWGGFTAAKTVLNVALANDNGAGNAQIFAQATAAATTLILQKNLGNWTLATDATALFGELTFEVQ